MPKDPKHALSPLVSKTPSFNASVAEARKQPKAASNPDSFMQEHPSWRLNHAQMEHPFGWHEMDAKTVGSVRNKLAQFESMTWAEILVKAKKNNHQIPFNKLSSEAQKRLQTLKLAYDEVVSLHLSGTERVVGVLEPHGVMHILWWDPSHGVCPSQKKHT